MKKGQVKWYDEFKGYGFIIEDSSNQEYFMHVLDIAGKIKGGDEVEFEIEQDKDGRDKACNVRII